MNKSITDTNKEQIRDASLASFLVSLSYSSIACLASASDEQANLERLVDMTEDLQEECEEKKSIIRQSKCIPEDDLKNIYFIASSKDLNFYSIGEQKVSKKFDLIKDGLKSIAGAKIFMFINKKTGQLYFINDCADVSETSNGIDIALCGKQNLDENNIDINSIPKASYWDEERKENVEIDNITLGNFGKYPPEDYFIKRLELYNKNCQNNGQDLKQLLKYFESCGIGPTNVDNYMARRLFIKRAEESGRKIGGITSFGYSFGANREIVACMLDILYDVDTARYKYKCISVNGLAPTNVQKKFFNDKIGENKVNNIVDSVLKVKGTGDWVAPVGSSASKAANEVFFETDKKAGKSHSTFSLRTDKGPVKPGALYEFYCYFYESILKSIDNNLENNRAYDLCHAFFVRCIHGEDLEGNKIEVKKWDFFVALCVIAKSVFFACFKFVGIKIKDCFMFLFLRKKYKKEIKIIDTPEKEKPKEENHNKENEIAKEQRIPKMENLGYKKYKVIG